MHFQCEVEEVQAHGSREIGIDLGLKDQVTCSDGEKYSRENLTKKYEIQLAMAQRAHKVKRVRAIHAKIKNKRKEFDFLLGLKKICKNSNGIIATNYKPSKNLKTQGRLFAQNASLQSLPREFRGALANGLLYDIDIVNAHPVLLQQYCEKNDIRCDNLKYYIENRDRILNEIMTEYDYSRDESKDLFLMCINGGYRDGITNRFYMELKKEIKEIHNLIILKNETHNMYSEIFAFLLVIAAFVISNVIH